MSMASGILRSLPILVLAFVLPLCQVAAQEDVQRQSPAQVLEDLLARHGDNSTITVPQLRSLLALLSQGDADAVRQNCLPEDTLAIYSMGEQSRLDGRGLQELCPTMLQQLDAGACRARAQDQLGSDTSPRPTDAEGTMPLCVTLISLCSLVGASVVPFMKKTFYKRLLLYFIALAIGTLYSNALFQLIPEALGFDPMVDFYASKSAVVFGGFYLFFFTEKILKMLLKQKDTVSDGHGHSHYSSAERYAAPGLDVEEGEKLQQNGELSAGHAPGKMDAGEGELMLHPSQTPQVSLRARACYLQLLVMRQAIRFRRRHSSPFDARPRHPSGDFVILLNAGMTIQQALFFNFLSACCCYLGMGFGILAGNSFSPNWIFALAGGMFLYISLADMVTRLAWEIGSGVAAKPSLAPLALLLGFRLELQVLTTVAANCETALILIEFLPSDVAVLQENFITPAVFGDILY
uniref:Metal cation symporter ZIP14 n=1 Tax=Hippocampus comes TaxID=109280 RepID=A0A3Q2YSD4_HIPCM